MFERPAASILAVLCLLGAAPSGTQPGDTAPPAAAPAAFSQTQRAAILAGAEKAVGDYTFSEKIPALRSALAANQATYLAIDDPQKFAAAVNADLYAVAHDKHLRIKYSALAVPMYGSESHGKADLEHMMQSQRILNDGYDAAIRLAGNVGYMRLDEFGSMPESKRTIDAAMTLLGNTDALVIDVRSNHGGDPDSLDYLMGYFYAKPTELTGMLITQGKPQLYKQFSEAHVAGTRYLGKPLYVLTSDTTFSCAEQFAYDMKSLHRATLIGKTTGGGANPGGFVPLDPHFAIFIPLGRSVNPYTQTNWEGVGVAPDVPTEPADALLVAYTQALEKAVNPFDEAAAARAAALKDPAKALASSMPSI